jgi:uncharacterized protein YrrD
MNSIDSGGGRITRASELIGRPIIALDSATQVAEVKDVVVDTQSAQAIGFTLRGRGLLAGPAPGFLPLEAVHAIGRDAVMVASRDAIGDPDDARSARPAEEEDLIGKEAVSVTGSSLGTVSDVILEIDGPSAAVVGYEIAAQNGNLVIVRAPESAPLSPDALVVPDEIALGAASGLASFRGSLERTQS